MKLILTLNNFTFKWEKYPVYSDENKNGTTKCKHNIVSMLDKH